MHLDSHQRAKDYIEEILPMKPDALVVGSDESAIWCCKVLKRKGYEVPGDISVFSLGKMPLGEAFDPEITAVDYEYGKIAKRAVEFVIENSKNKNKKILKELLPGKILVRESCKIL